MIGLTGDLLDLKIIGGASHPDLVNGICKHLNITPIATEFGIYPNDNQWVKIKDNIREHKVFIVQTSYAPVDHFLMQAMMLVDAAARASADRITLVTPYFPYVRSDKKDEPRIAITASLVCKMLEAAGVYRFLAMDLHSAQIQGFATVFDNLYGGSCLCDAVRGLVNDGCVVVAPDIGSAKLNRKLAVRAGIKFAGMFDKERVDSYNVNLRLVADPKTIEGKHVFSFDDEILTGGTGMECASYLKKQVGAASFSLCAFHGILPGGTVGRIEDSDIDQIIVTNSIPQHHHSSKIIVVDIAPLLAEAIKRIYLGESLSELFPED